ncbi:M14 family metallopeptidase [uncultured Megasphaera sp.]|uniref:M14 family metallopeptidase n=1 Tax=uncultured Megasphaera sp. TaxID=165188 RepID=UPI002657D3B5|nr:M14 family metallopeptidase [uncultured Megasphaera sp.]
MKQCIAQIPLPADEVYEIQKNHLVSGNGSKRICIVSGTHGDELEGQYVCFRLQELLRQYQDKWQGTVDIYPCLNPLGMDSITRGVPMFDLDMNRIFPGDPKGSMVEYIASCIMDDLTGADLVIDIHASNIYLREIPQIRINELQQDVLVPMGKWLNMDYIWVHSASTVLESTLAYSLNERHTPTLVVEMGVGMRITKAYGDQLCQGILNAMVQLGMMESMSLPVKKPIISTDGQVHFLNAVCAGLFLPNVRHDHRVLKGEVIGRIVHPLEGQVRHEVVSPCSGLLFTLREYPIVSEGSLMGRILECEG